MQDKFSELESKAGKEAADALRELYSLYGSSTYEWLAGLWDPEIGGFYYSEDGRDYEGFLPDIESSLQVLSIIKGSGMIAQWGNSLYDAIPKDIQKKLVDFTKSLASPDGYYYHPQWGKDIITRRLSRDLTWAISMLKNFHENPPMPTALDLLSGDNKAEVTKAPHLASAEAFEKYLKEMDVYKHSYVSGSTIGSQISQIKAAGLEDMLIEHYNSLQNPKNGLWADNVNYYTVSGLLKISSSYRSLGKKIPNAWAAAESAIENIMCDEHPTSTVHIFNPWVSLGNLANNAEKFGDCETADRIRGEVIGRAAQLLRKTSEKIKLFRKPDGSYSYYTDRTSATSQDAPVSLGRNEGDVNATMLVMNGATGSFFEILGIKDIPIYDSSDFRRFMSLLYQQKSPVKKPIPEEYK